MTERAPDGYSIFISYAHADEAFKDALTLQLKGFRREGLLAPWDDRCIDGGDDWHDEIAHAIERCDLALLLVSPAFIASDFIYGEELPRLRERCERDGIRIVPIILRPCTWRLQEQIASLQARPADGKPIIGFAEHTGERDQAWLEIVEEIVGWARQPRTAAVPTAGPRAADAALASLDRLRAALAAGEPETLDAATHQRLLSHSPRDLDDYRITRFAQWSQPRYRIDKRFTRLNVLLDQGPKAQGQRWQEQAQDFVDLREVLAQVGAPALVLLGPPGCGKSTLLQRLELDLAIDGLRAADPATAPVTLLLPLNRYRPAADGEPWPSPVQWLAEQWQRPRHRQLPRFEDLLASGRLVLLLDAINEMPHADADEYRQRIGRWRDFLAELPQLGPGTRVVFSCRSLDYSAPLSSPQLAVPHVRVKALDDGQVADFLDRHGGEHGARLWRQLRGTPQLEVFRSPFFLRLLVELPGAGEALHSGRAALFTLFVRHALAREVGERQHPLFAPDGLLERHDYERILRNEWADSFELAANSLLFAALAEFAVAMQAGRAEGASAHVRLRYGESLALLAGNARAEDLLEAAAALQVLVVERDEVLFCHQLLQEYFAARSLALAPQPEHANSAWRADEVSPPLDEVLATLADSDPLPALAATGWEETQLLAAAMSPDALAHVTALAERNLPLAGRCAAQPDVQLPEEARDGLRQALIERSRDPQADLRARIAAARALGELGDPRFARRDGANGPCLLPPTVAIEGGEYPIGSDEGLFDNESPVHRVVVRPFALGRFPVTNAEFRCFVEAGGYEDGRWWHGEAAQRWWRGESTADGPKQQWREDRSNLQVPGRIDKALDRGRITSKQASEWKRIAALSDTEFEAQLDEWYPAGRQTQPALWNDPASNHPAQPVVGIGWFEARAFCAWLASQTGEPWRLPSEAEWEAAARGHAARRYPWGEAFSAARCNAFETHVRTTTPVGIFAGGDGPEGFSDLSGNVWEWTSTLYRTYRYDADDGREDDAADGPRVLRGGSWFNGRDNTRCANRGWDPPGTRNDNIGFRVCRAPRVR